MKFLNKKTITLVIVLNVISLKSIADYRLPKIIKDPIFPEYTCETINVTKEGDKLISKGEMAVLTCNTSGYTAFVFGEDELTKSEVKSIRKFLEKAKKDLKVTSDFNYFNMTMIDAIWFIQNIYQRRNISLEKYIKVMEETKKLVITLLGEINLDIRSLKKCDLLDESKAYLCTAYVFGPKDYVKKTTKNKSNNKKNSITHNSKEVLQNSKNIDLKYFESTAKEIFKIETGIADPINVDCSKDRKIKTAHANWICKISEQRILIEDNKSQSNNPSQWLLYIDYIKNNYKLEKIDINKTKFTKGK